MAQRPAVSRDLVVEAAVRVADAGGLVALSMRNVGRELGVEAMSLYHHVRGKEDLLDALVDRVFAEIHLPAAAARWRPAMVDRARSARAVLRAHPWALGLIESRRTPLPALLHHHDTVLGCLRHHGFSVTLAAHALSALDAYVYGFVLTELNLPFLPGEDAEDFVEAFALPADDHPHLAELIAELVVGQDYDYADEFDFGLELILDGLAARRRAESRAAR